MFYKRALCRLLRSRWHHLQQSVRRGGFLSRIIYRNCKRFRGWPDSHRCLNTVISAKERFCWLRCIRNNSSCVKFDSRRWYLAQMKQSQCLHAFVYTLNGDYGAHSVQFHPQTRSFWGASAAAALHQFPRIDHFQRCGLEMIIFAVPP